MLTCVQVMIDRKLEPLVKRQMTKYLGELEDDDLIMFVLEHLKDHKGPQKLIEGLEPVRVQPPFGVTPHAPATCTHERYLHLRRIQVLEEEASEFVVSIWRQIIFESIAYGEGLHTEKLMVD